MDKQRLPSLRKSIILEKLSCKLHTMHLGDDRKRNVLETQNMTCWSKLWKRDLLIPQLLCKIQLYRTITTAAACLEKKALKEIQEGERKRGWAAGLPQAGRNEWGYGCRGMHMNQGRLPPASNQLITTFQLTQQLLIKCLIIHGLFSCRRLFTYILFAF